MVLRRGALWSVSSSPRQLGGFVDLRQRSAQLDLELSRCDSACGASCSVITRSVVCTEQLRHRGVEHQSRESEHQEPDAESHRLRSPAQLRPKLPRESGENRWRQYPASVT